MAHVGAKFRRRYLGTQQRDVRLEQQLRDGRYLVLRRSADEAEPTGTSVVLNWTAELKGRLRN